MIGLRWTVLGCVAGLLVVLMAVAGCGSSSPFNDTPQITNLFPSSATVGGPSFTLLIQGTGFITTSAVYWNNVLLTGSSFDLNTDRITVTVPAADIATVGTAQIEVNNPAPGGGVSTAVTFAINQAGNPIPTITSLSPNTTPLGVLPPNGQITVTGTNFISASGVSFNGNAHTAAFVSSTQLTVTVLAADVAANATLNVTVSNPAPGGGVSPALPFKVGTGNAIRVKQSLIAGDFPLFPIVISQSAAGGASDGASSAPSMSADGRFIAFYSTAKNLVAQGASGTIFVRDMCVGVENCLPQTYSVDLASNGSAANAASSPAPSISADGRYVAFASAASNLPTAFSVGAESSSSNVFVRDTCLGADAPAGCMPQTILVSASASGSPASGASQSPSLSTDGRFVAFTSTAKDLLPGGLSSQRGVYVRDTCAGASAPASCSPSTHVLPSAGNALEAGSVTGLNISGDGRYVVFSAVPPGSATATQVFVADTCLGANATAVCVPSVKQLSADASFESSDNGSKSQSISPSINADGRFVVYESQAASPAFAVSPASPSVFLRDTCQGASAPSNCVAATTLIASSASSPSIDSTGRYISFVAQTGGGSDPGILTVYDTCLAADDGCVPGAQTLSFELGASVPASLSSDGSLIAFSTLYSVPASPLSGQGDVLLTPTPF